MAGVFLFRVLAAGLSLRKNVLVVPIRGRAELLSRQFDAESKIFRNRFRRFHDGKHQIGTRPANYVERIGAIRFAGREPVFINHHKIVGIDSPPERGAFVAHFSHQFHTLRVL